jgi:hypothetical protein
MRTYSTPAIAVGIVTTLLFGYSALAHDHNFLNGTWTLASAQSDFAGHPVIQSGAVTINSREGNVTVSRNFVYEGATETLFYRDTTDAENGATIHSGRDLKSKVKWDDDVLKVTTTQSGAVTVESYSLGPDGTMVARVVGPDHRLITLVFQGQ